MKKKTSSKQVLFFALLWAITYIGCLLAVKEFEWSKPAGLLFSFLPAVTFIFFIYHYIIGISEMDEVQRRIQLEATVWAFSLGMLMLMILGLLDYVVILKKQDWGYTHLIPYFFTFYFFGVFISHRKYNSK